MADTFKPAPPRELVKAALAIKLLPDTMRRLEGHAKANGLHRNELASQILEYQIAKLGEPKTNGAS